MIKIYIGYTDHTWKTAMVELPTSQLSDSDRDAWYLQKAIEVAAPHAEIAFTGYNEQYSFEESEEQKAETDRILATDRFDS